MKKEIIGRCPVCEHELKVTELHCNYCDTTIKSEFELCKFCKLPKDQLLFAEIFIKNRGNIKEIEKELGISYPTVRNKLESLIESLGHNPKYESKVNKKEILEKLSSGEISAEEAVKLLKD
ncbi:MAG: DUF2089 domain-containing protein [Tissierellales bacterium]|jgi:hypothetical protein|nr:DUF2089 domain-containing protein [Tissierellales bacterium]